MTMRDLKDVLRPLETLEPSARWLDVLEREPRVVPEPRPSRAAVYVFAGGALAIVVVIAMAMSPLGQGHGTPADEADSPPVWLVDQAYRFAYASGDITPTSAEWVLAGMDEIAPAVGLDHGDPQVQEYLVVLHGSFTGYWAKVPQGTEVPSGDHIAFAIDPMTHEVTDSSIGGANIAIPNMATFSLPPTSGWFSDEVGGWTAAVPPGWFAGALTTGGGPDGVEETVISNTRSITAGSGDAAPPQVSSERFPDDGVALVVTLVDDPPPVGQMVNTPPLSIDEFEMGGSGGGSTLDVLWFTNGERLFVASLRMGQDASAVDRDAIASVIASLTFGSTNGSRSMPDETRLALTHV
jgi:hypothetical protein